MQLGTEKLFAYAELMKSEFNKILEIFPIFICLTSFSRFAVMITKLIRNSLFKIEGHVSGIGSLLNFNEAFYTSLASNNVLFLVFSSWSPGFD